MTTTSVRGRIPAGVPTGGQFASLARTEPGLSLVDATGDPDHAVDVAHDLAARALHVAAATPEQVDALSFHPDSSIRQQAAKVARDPFVLDRLSRDDDAWVRRTVAASTHAPVPVLEDLGADDVEGVRATARQTLAAQRKQVADERAKHVPVMGPGRPRAAARAIAELAAAQTAREADPWSDTTLRRLTEARRIRDFYPEYDDSLTRG